MRRLPRLLKFLRGNPGIGPGCSSASGDPIADDLGRLKEHAHPKDNPWVEPLGQSTLDERFQWLVFATNNTIRDWNLSTDDCWWSDGLQRDYGYDPIEIARGADFWSEAIHPHDRTGVLARLHSAIECGSASWSDEYRFRRADGSYAFILERGCLVRNEAGSAVRLIGSMMDITRQKEAEQELKRLAGRIIEAQETERSRVARELHDSVIQILSAANFRLHHIQEHAAAPELQPHFAKAKELLGHAIREIRLISRNLRPSELDDLGLMAALRTLLREFQERTGIVLALSSHRFPKAMAPEIELALYRIVQEALSNIERHSRATEVHIRFAREGIMLLASIRDNGSGFVQRGGSGFGLMNMKERAAQAGGKLEIVSSPLAGTEISLTIPMIQAPVDL